MKRRIFSMLLVLLTVLSLCPAAAAVEGSAEPAGMELAWSSEDTQVTVKLSLTSPGTTSGRAVIAYDPAVLTLRSAAAAEEQWATSIDAETPGEVAFAWVASTPVNGQTLLLTLVFDAPSGGCTTTVTAKMGELYRDDSPVALPADAVAEISVYVAVIPSTPGGGSSGGGTVTPGGEEEKRENPFTDIDGHWAESEIIEAYYAGLVKGIGNGLFAPNMELTRGMFATLLYRLAGSPAVTGANPFPDVTADWYHDAIIWAYENGVVTGTPEGLFLPDVTLTREQMVTMLHRYAAFAGMSTVETTELDGFADAADVSAYALEAMQWAVASGIIKGQNGNLLAPAGITTRAQAAAVLVRFAG